MATRLEVYEKFGLAAEAGQLLETELITAILSLEALERGWIEEPNATHATKVLRELDNLTLGHLMRRLRKQFNIKEDQISFLGDSLKARNSLNHGFFERHNFKIQSSDGRDEMMEDLEQIHQVLFDAWQAATILSDTMVSAVKLLKNVNDGKSSD